MTRTARAIALAERQEAEAARLRSAARRAGTHPHGARLRLRASAAERTAAEWRAQAAEEALREEGLELRECCSVSISDPCTPECGCEDCDAERAAQDDADAYFDRCND